LIQNPAVITGTSWNPDFLNATFAGTEFQGLYTDLANRYTPVAALIHCGDQRRVEYIGNARRARWGMGKRTAGLAAALALSVSGWPAAVNAAAPPLGTREGELLCVGLTNVLASGALLSTGGDAVSAATAHGVFLGRLSVLAPDARYSLDKFLDVYGKMTPAEQDQLARNCFAELEEIDAIKGTPPPPKSAKHP
jgi:hypothetical protein